MFNMIQKQSHLAASRRIMLFSWILGENPRIVPGGLDVAFFVTWLGGVGYYSYDFDLFCVVSNQSCTHFLRFLTDNRAKR